MSGAKKRVHIEEVDEEVKGEVKKHSPPELTDEEKALQKRLDDAVRDFDDANKACDSLTTKLNDLREEALSAERKRFQKLLDLSNLRLQVLSSSNAFLQNKLKELEVK